MQRILRLVLVALPLAAACGGGEAEVKEPATSPVAPAASPKTVTQALPPTTTPSLTGTPEVREARVEVGQYHVKQDEISTRVVGTVENKGTTPATRIQVTVWLLNEAGQTVAAGESIYTRDVLPPGERSPFLVTFTQRYPEWQTERLQVQAEEALARQPPASQASQARLQAEGLTVEGVTVEPPANQFDRYTIRGQVRNGGQQTAQFVAVLGILYDAEGKPVDVKQMLITPEQMDPGQTAPFALDFPFTKENVPVATYEVYVQGQVKS